MANKKYKLGKVVGTVNGYKVRIMLKESYATKTDRFGRVQRTGESRWLHSGTYGIYAGKNLCRDGFKTVEDALEYAKEY